MNEIPEGAVCPFPQGEETCADGRVLIEDFMFGLIRGWLQRRKDERALIQADAAELIAHFGDGAEAEAMFRHAHALSRNETRAARRWAQVGKEIKKRLPNPSAGA